MGRKIYITEAQLKNLLRTSLLRESEELNISEMSLENRGKRLLEIFKKIASGEIKYNMTIEDTKDLSFNRFLAEYFISLENGCGFYFNCGADIKITVIREKGDNYLTAPYNDNKINYSNIKAEVVWAGDEDDAVIDETIPTYSDYSYLLNEFNEILNSSTLINEAIELFEKEYADELSDEYYNYLNEF